MISLSVTFGVSHRSCRASELSLREVRTSSLVIAGQMLFSTVAVLPHSLRVGTGNSKLSKSRLPAWLSPIEEVYAAGLRSSRPVVP
jgi:hypothetical protein